MIYHISIFVLTIISLKKTFVISQLPHGEDTTQSPRVLYVLHCSILYPRQYHDTVEHAVTNLHALTHWGWDKMAAISQPIFANAFPWMKLLEFVSTFHQKFVTEGKVNNISTLFQIMDWCWPGEKPLSEPKMFSLLMDKFVTHPQWIYFLSSYVLRLQFLIASHMNLYVWCLLKSFLDKNWLSCLWILVNLVCCLQNYFTISSWINICYTIHPKIYIH